MAGPTELFGPESFGLFAVAAAGAGALTLAARRRLAGRAVPLLFGALSVMLLLPLGGLPLAAYLRGMVGEPSFGLLALIGTALLPSRDAALTPGRRAASLLVVVAAAGLLYPLALGAGALDPYRWGFGEPYFVAAVLALGLAALWRRWPLLPAGIALAVLGWSLGAYESRNLWDYLLDPLLAAYALCALPRALWRAAKRPA